jgi:hypothetical protein
MDKSLWRHFQYKILTKKHPALTTGLLFVTNRRMHRDPMSKNYSLWRNFFLSRSNLFSLPQGCICHVAKDVHHIIICSVNQFMQNTQEQDVGLYTHLKCNKKCFSIKTRVSIHKKYVLQRFTYNNVGCHLSERLRRHSWRFCFTCHLLLLLLTSWM